jgi:hypothetical protein
MAVPFPRRHTPAPEPFFVTLPSGSESDYRRRVTGKADKSRDSECWDAVAERMVAVAWCISSTCGMGRRRAVRSVSEVVPRLNWPSLSDDPTGRNVRGELIAAMSARAGRRGSREFADAVHAAVARDEITLLPSPQRELVAAVLVEHLDLEHAAERSRTPSEQAPVLLRSALTEIASHLDNG